jgi:hypothetical protein
MKLNIVPAKQGALWVRLGIRTFWKQPLALTGLFFMFMTIMSLANLIPIIGSVLAISLVPAISLGLMAATREVDLGKFPMPWILACAFRVGKERKREMIILGIFYAVGFIGILGLSTLIDGGEFVSYMYGDTHPNSIKNISPDMMTAMWFTVSLDLLLSSIFWYAPALIHWHSIHAVKSLFFSTVAFISNWRAFLVFGLTWFLVSSATLSILALLGVLLDNLEFTLSAALPAVLMLSAMFSCSTYFSFKDSFISDTIYA